LGGLLGAIILTLTAIIGLMVLGRPAPSAKPRKKSTVEEMPSLPANIVEPSISPVAKSAGRSRGRGLTTALIGAMLVSMALAGTALASDAPDATLEHVPGSGMNDAPFWEEYFETRFEGTTWECAKVNEPTDPTIGDAEDAVIIKAGTTNYVWFDDPTTAADELHSGTYTSPGPNSTSHYLTCLNTTIVEDIEIKPAGDIRGPCADPAYFAVFDNTESSVAITFRFRWYNFNGLNTVTKTVEAGDYFITRQKWVRAYTTMRIGYKDPVTGVWTNLVTEQSGKGRYPACTAESHGYIPGFGTGTVPADPSQA
jgi:hypothetical protein